MSESLLNVGGALIAEKGPSASLAYTFDYTPDLAGRALTNSVWTEGTGGVTLSGSSFTATQATINVSGGTAGGWYVINNVATDDSTPPQIHQAQFQLYVKDLAVLGAGFVTPFPNILAAIAALRRDRLYQMLLTYAPGIVLSDEYLLEQIMSAISYIQHRLRVFLVPTEMLPNTALQAEIDVFANAVPPVNYALEPAYDYDPEFFQGDRFGLIHTRQRPIIALHSMGFYYPQPGQSVWNVPDTWFRVDRKYGAINLLPYGAGSFSIPLNAFILSALGGGRIVPGFIQIRYRAGLVNCARDWPEILNLVRQQAVYSLWQNLFLPSSRSSSGGSVSADGLSQTDGSLSVSIGDMGAKYGDQIDAQIDKITQALFGIRVWSV